MAAKQFGVPIDLMGFELRQARTWVLAAAPANPTEGLAYYDSVLKVERFWDGTAWIDRAGLSEAEQLKFDGIEEGATANSTDAELRDRTTHTGTQGIETITGLQDGLDAKQDLSEKGQPDGYASLDGDGKVFANQMPSIAVGEQFPVADEAEMLALGGATPMAHIGDVALRTDTSTRYMLVGDDASLLSNWIELANPENAVLDITTVAPIVTSGGQTPQLSLALGGITTDLIGDEQVTEAKLSTDVQTKLNAPQGALKHAETIGDGTATAFTITHSMNTRDVQVSVYEAGGTYSEIMVDVERTTVDAVTVRFGLAPTAGQYRVVVVG